MSQPKTKSLRLVLAIDPGYERLGWAVGQVKRSQIIVLDQGCLTTPKKLDHFKRLGQIKTQLTQIISQYQVQELAIEDLFFGRNTTTALKVAETRGLIFGLALDHKMKIYEYHPQSIKLAVTGHGRSDKKSLEKMVRRLLKLDTQPLIDDTIDALAILITHSVQNRL